MGNLKLTSPAFSDGGEIPRECGYKNGNGKPAFTISGVPSEAKSLVIIMDDPDAMEAVGKVWVHWILWNIYPACTEISADARPFASKEGTNDFGAVGYGGPAPPDKRHTYIFKLYALDTELPKRISNVSTKADVEKAMEGHIIEQATLTGTYAP